MSIFVSFFVITHYLSAVAMATAIFVQKFVKLISLKKERKEV